MTQRTRYTAEDERRLAAEVAEGRVTDPLAEQFTLRRRALPDSLRYLAGKLREGEQHREAVAAALEMMADQESK